MVYTLKQKSHYIIAFLGGTVVIAAAFLFSPVLSGMLCLLMAGIFLFALRSHLDRCSPIPDNAPHKKVLPPAVINDPFSILENDLLKKTSPIKGRYIFVDFCFSETDNKIREKISCQRAQETLGNPVPSSKKCHLGLACFANFAIAAVTQPQKIILFDYDPNVVEFNKIVIELLKSSNTSDEFKTLLVKKCKESALFKHYEFLPKLNNKGDIMRFSNLWKARDQFENLRRIFNLPESFLANEQHFAYIKKLAVEQNIHVFLGNILDPEVITNTAEVLNQNGYYLDSLYLSNVYDWFPKQTGVLDKHINALCKQGTLLVKGTNEGITVSHYGGLKGPDAGLAKSCLASEKFSVEGGNLPRLY